MEFFESTWSSRERHWAELILPQSQSDPPIKRPVTTHYSMTLLWSWSVSSTLQWLLASSLACLLLQVFQRRQQSPLWTAWPWMLNIKTLEFSTKNANANVMTHDIMHNFQNIMQKNAKQKPSKIRWAKSLPIFESSPGPWRCMQKRKQTFPLTHDIHIAYIYIYIYMAYIYIAYIKHI